MRGLRTCELARSGDGFVLPWQPRCQPMQNLDSLRIEVPRDEALEVAAILCKHMPAGLWFTQRRWWFFWVRFTASGPPRVIAALQLALEHRDMQKFIENAW